MPRGWASLVALLIAGASLAGCATPSSSEEAEPDVVASFYPIEYLARRIAGDMVVVGGLVANGVAPHDYEPTPKDVARVTDAKLLLVQGAGFESWIDTARKNAPDARIVIVTEGLELRAGGGHDHENEEHEGEADEGAHDESEGANDPHTWLDPVLFAQTARNVERAMAETFPEHRDAFAARADMLVANLTSLHEEFETGLAECELDVIVTTHAAFGYMASRYGFEMVPISGLDPEAEPSSEAVKRATEEARAHNVTIIFFEELVSARVAEVVAREVGAQTRVLSPVEGIPPAEAAQGATYETKMRDNLRNLREALRCE